MQNVHQKKDGERLAQRRGGADEAPDDLILSMSPCRKASFVIHAALFSIQLTSLSTRGRENFSESTHLLTEDCLGVAQCRKLGYKTPNTAKRLIERSTPRYVTICPNTNGMKKF